MIMISILSLLWSGDLSCPYIIIRDDLSQVSSGDHFKSAYKLLNLKAFKSSHLNKICIFQCMGRILCVEFQRVDLKFHTKYLTHTLFKDMILLCYIDKSSCAFLKCPPMIQLYTIPFNQWTYLVFWFLASRSSFLIFCWAFRKSFSSGLQKQVTLTVYCTCPNMHKKVH